MLNDIYSARILSTYILFREELVYSVRGSVVQCIAEVGNQSTYFFTSRP